MPIILIKKLWRSSLHRNAIYLMATYVITACVGFFFWMLCARLYLAEDLGNAMAMVSAVCLIASISMLGFNIGLVRFLPETKNKNEMICSCFVITSICAVALAAIFLVGLDIWSPNLLFMRKSWLVVAIFVGAVIFFALYALTDAVFLSRRKTSYTLGKNLIFALIKLVLPIFLVAFGAYGIFLSFSLAAAVALGVALLIFVPVVVKNIRWKLTIETKLVNDMMHYSVGNYVAGIFAGLPGFLFPLMIVNIFQPEFTAYFYVAWVIAGLVFMIPGAVASSLFAEGSNRPKMLNQNVKRAFKFSFLLVIPAMVTVIFLDEKLLLLFGREYSETGAELFRILALSSVLTVPNIIYTTKINVEKRIRLLLWLSVVGAVSTLITSYILLIEMGLVGVGYGWMVGQGVVLGVVAVDCSHHH
jgi:O-antigen/teichoic acid export membrane protein